MAEYLESCVIEANPKMLLGLYISLFFSLVYHYSLVYNCFSHFPCCTNKHGERPSFILDRWVFQKVHLGGRLDR